MFNQVKGKNSAVRAHPPKRPTQGNARTTDISFAFKQPKPKKAHQLANEAIKLAKRGKSAESIPLLERAFRLDQIGCLNRYCSLRADISASLGQNNPRLALDYYRSAFQFIQCREFTEAKLGYLEAFVIDPQFLWAANNYARLLASSTEAYQRNGPKAIEFARTVCDRSRWNCWIFIDTLAAAYAEAGYFSTAMGWQNAAVELAPPPDKVAALTRLDLYRAGRAFEDRDALMFRNFNINFSPETHFNSKFDGVCVVCGLEVAPNSKHRCPGKIDPDKNTPIPRPKSKEQAQTDGKRLNEGFDLLRERGDWPDD